MFHGYSNSKCKVLMEKKYIEVYYKVLINKFKVGYMCVSGPWKHTRGLGAVLEMEVQKEKIKNVSILWWSSWRQILKLYIYPCKLFG